MSLRRFDRPLDELLDSLARVKPEHGEALSAGAEAIRAIFADLAQLPRVVITTGWDADPVVLEVEQLADILDGLSETQRDAAERVDDILRLLRKRLHEPATETSTGAPA